ncbi:unnamed protein product [Oikopleura dioica]|uniref:Uncharacterized protein n=1 Tax=Oikopleura dioica TaxID=34765 RepID=E4XSK9_OIKDI|nr:unnamed protein product [Oikopleura dioica]
MIGSCHCHLKKIKNFLSKDNLPLQIYQEIIQRCHRQHRDKANHPARQLVPNRLQGRYQLQAAYRDPRSRVPSACCPASPSLPQSDHKFDLMYAK